MALSDKELLALAEVERQLLADQLLDWLVTIGFPAPQREVRRRLPSCPQHRRRRG